MILIEGNYRTGLWELYQDGAVVLERREVISLWEDVEGVCPPPIQPDVIFDDLDAAAIVKRLLTGPIGPVGPIGAQGTNGRDGMSWDTPLG